MANKGCLIADPNLLWISCAFWIVPVLSCWILQFTRCWWGDQMKNWSSGSLSQVGKFKTCVTCCFRSPPHRLGILRACGYRYIKVLCSGAEICNSSGRAGPSLLWLNLGPGIYTLISMAAHSHYQRVTTTSMDCVHCFLASFPILIHQTECCSAAVIPLSNSSL